MDYVLSEKKSKSTTSQTESNHHHIDKNRRKLLSPYRRSTPIITKSKINGVSRRLSPILKNVESSSSSSIDINRFQYPFLIPSTIHQIPFALPLRTTLSEHVPSTLSRTLTKGLVSNYTCILPTIIPLPIPIPMPLHLSCMKCPTDVINQECQTEKRKHIHSVAISQKRARQKSI